MKNGSDKICILSNVSIAETEISYFEFALLLQKYLKNVLRLVTNGRTKENLNFNRMLNMKYK